MANGILNKCFLKETFVEYSTYICFKCGYVSYDIKQICENELNKNPISVLF